MKQYLDFFVSQHSGLTQNNIFDFLLCKVEVNQGEAAEIFLERECRIALTRFSKGVKLSNIQAAALRLYLSSL
jgi:hypothetical protein